MDGEVAVEKSVGEIQPPLAVAHDGPDLGKAPADGGGHVLPVFVAVVIALLFRGEGFVLQVFAQAGADLEGGAEVRREWRTGKEWLKRSTSP
jgi:hypothetical protein